ncbi:MAG: DUF4097 family beta strand repeat protein [Phycisphaeraceae bacterium]|nr:DUF4097 family beta strand repeat protein [Phycisphaeraceae bacterium]
MIATLARSARPAVPIAAATLTIWSLLSGCVIAQPALKEETRTVTADHVPQSPLAVTTQNGGISVTAVPNGPVSITAVIRAEDDDRLKATDIVAERKSDGALEIYAKWPDGKRRNRESCSFEIQLPDAGGVTLTTSNGAVSLTGLAGDASITTSNGRITCTDHDGNVTARTTNGAVEVSRSRGKIDATTSNGSIKVDQAPSSVQCTSSNGAITVAMTDSAEGPVRIKTSNGAVRLSVGQAFAGFLDLSTSQGGINLANAPAAKVVSKTKNAARLQFGDAIAPSTIQTSNGSIEITTTVGPTE